MYRVPRTVVRVSVGKSQALYSWEGGRQGATALASIGSIRVDLPQHPVALHGVMTRSSRQLSSTLQVRAFSLLPGPSARLEFSSIVRGGLDMAPCWITLTSTVPSRSPRCRPCHLWLQRVKVSQVVACVGLIYPCIRVVCVLASRPPPCRLYTEGCLSVYILSS